MENSSVIIIQKYIRKFLIYKKILIPSSYYQTKQWRQQRVWYKNGKYNECEKYQISTIEKIISLKLNKTYERIHITSFDIIENKNPMTFENGFEFTENFDGIINKNNKTYYYNLKFVCDQGGSQTRTLREVYHFIYCQLKYIIEHNSTSIYFINILDGNTCYQHMNKFTYLLKKYNHIHQYIFIGDLHQYQNSPKYMP